MIATWYIWNITKVLDVRYSLYDSDKIRLVQYSMTASIRDHYDYNNFRKQKQMLMKCLTDTLLKMIWKISTIRTTWCPWNFPTVCVYRHVWFHLKELTNFKVWHKGFLLCSKAMRLHTGYNLWDRREEQCTITIVLFKLVANETKDTSNPMLPILLLSTDIKWYSCKVAQIVM